LLYFRYLDPVTLLYREDFFMYQLILDKFQSYQLVSGKQAFIPAVKLWFRGLCFAEDR
jgi:hypothetical protein